MSYDIKFKVKVEGADAYVEVGDCTANITWNVREIITQSTGLEWNNEENNGLCTDVIPKITQGVYELSVHPEKYRHLKARNGCGTVQETKDFFIHILKDWWMFQKYYPELEKVATFWIV